MRAKMRESRLMHTPHSPSLRITGMARRRYLPTKPQPRGSICRSGPRIGERARYAEMRMMTSWTRQANTEATAAPVAPMAGKPSLPKIST